MQTLRIKCPGALTSTDGFRKLEHYTGIEFVRGASNGGGDNGYYQMIGDEELLDSLYFHNLIKVGLVKDAVVQAYLNQTNWAKDEAGNSVDLSGADGSDVMVCYPTLYAVLGGTNSVYERFIVSDQPFSYDGDEAEEIEAFADTPDYETLVNSVSRSIYDESVAGTQGTSYISGVDRWQETGGYPSCSTTRYNYETYAKNKGEAYQNATTHDLELKMALMFIEFRTKNLNGCLGHGLSSNQTPTEATWGTVSGARITSTQAGTLYRTLSSNSSIYINGTVLYPWQLMNTTSPILKMFEAQRLVSNGETLEGVTNGDGEAVQGKGSGVMTGILTLNITGALPNYSSTAEGETETATIELCLRIPLWRGYSRLWGNIFQHLSGQDVYNYVGSDGEVHNDLYRAKKLSDILVGGSNSDLGFMDTYEFIADLGGVRGYCDQALSTSEGRVLATALRVSGNATISTYECAYNYVNTDGTLGRGNGGIFGGAANRGNCSLRYCYPNGAPSFSSTSCGSGFRCSLVA